MLTTVCGAKGGQGCATVTGGLTLIGAPAVVVDAGGDVPAVLGVPEPAGPGVVDLLLSDLPVTVEALRRLLVEVGTTGVVPRGDDRVGDVTTQRWQELGRVLTDDGARWLVDAGTGPAVQTAMVSGVLVLLVVRNCFLALRRSVQCTPRPDGVVLVSEPHRALDVRDVEAVLPGVPITAVRTDPAVARAVDAGLLAARLPRSLRGDLTLADA
jgi:hypothetical protein